MSRQKSSIVNARYTALFYVANLVASLYSRKFVIQYLGIRYSGLGGTLGNIIGLLTLAELGVSTSVIYRLYEPLAKKNYVVVSDVLSVLMYYYRRVGLIILVGGVVMTIFIPLVFKHSEIDIWIIYLTFWVSIFAASAGYLLNSRQLLFFADQKGFLQVSISNSISLLKVIVQVMALCFLKEGVLFYLFLELLATMVTSFFINRRIEKRFPWLKASSRQGRRIKSHFKHVKRDSLQIFSHQFASYVLTQTDQVFIFAMVSLTSVGIYSNYLMLVQRISGFVVQSFSGVTASVGNLISNESLERIICVFWELTILRFWVAASIIFSLFCLTDYFIGMWLGKAFVLGPNIYYFLLINAFILLIRQTNDSFLTCLGLFTDVKAPWIEALLNIVFSIVLGRIYGVAGILAGTTISLIPIVVIWKPYFLFTKGFNASPTSYFVRIGKLIFISTALGIAFYPLVKTMCRAFAHTWLNFMLIAVGCFVGYGILLFLLFALFDEAMVSLLKRSAIWAKVDLRR